MQSRKQINARRRAQRAFQKRAAAEWQAAKEQQHVEDKRAMQAQK